MIMSRVYVGTLDPNVTKEQLEDEARQFGKVEDIWIARNPAGFAFITYEDLRDAEDAVRGMAGKRIGEQRCAWSSPRTVAAVPLAPVATTVAATEVATVTVAVTASRTCGPARRSARATGPARSAAPMSSP